jgi:hypothetical protein
MGRSTDVILPARFLLTIGHFVVTVLAFSSVDMCAAAGLPSDASTATLAATKQSMLAALALSIITFIVQFGGLFFGFSLFTDRTNLLLCVLNFFGGVLLAWALVDVWTVPTVWALVVCFSFLSGAVEATTISKAALSKRA